MLSTHTIPDSENHSRRSAPPVGAAVLRGSDPDTPTLRVPAERPAAPPKPAAPFPPAVTPPPRSDLDFSCSVWSATGEDDVPTARRSPEVGDTVLGFKLVGELGRGAFARVFLAHQEALAGRPVALKVSLRPTREAQRLARLQHTNVVPVYSVHDANSVQVICMPYLGRTTLADLIRAYQAEAPSRHSGRKSTAARVVRTTAVESGSKGSKPADSAGGSSAPRAPVWTWAAAEPPPIVGDPRAVLEVVSQLAAGLTHAHERGILHLDLKPANVLLADTGEPMLLDFNLSVDTAQPDREVVGGTMPYMAIEQLLDMRNRRRGAVDARTDLFALGAMAYELLTGTVPFAVSSKEMCDIGGQVAARHKGPPPLRPRNAAVTPAVEAIVRKLLAPEPADRYQTAAELKTDVDRHLADLPLRFARDRSPLERFGKWRRRNPRAPYRLLVACVAGLALGAAALAYRGAESNARHEAAERAKDARAGLDGLRLDLVLPDDAKARDRGVARATDVLAGYGLPGDADWQKRPAVRRLSAADRATLAGDLGELLALVARAKWHGADALPEADRRDRAAEVWKWVAAARGCFAGPAPAAVDRLAARVAPSAGEPFDPPADAEPEAAARALFLDAALSLNQGRYAAAAEVLERAVADRPDHAAAQFFLAYCCQQAGQFPRALERYDMARVLLPNDPRPVLQRGLIYALTKRPDKAEVEFTKALALDANHADAYRYRGLARYRLGTAEKMAGAEADLTAALDRGASAAFIHYVRGKLRRDRGDAAGAAADAAAVEKLTVATEADYVVRGWTRIESDPKGARADFEKAIQLNPRSLVAHQNLAHVLAEKLRDNTAALGVATKTAELYPEYAPARAGRAVVLARLGRRDEAYREIAEARQLAPDNPDITYRAASVFALTSASDADARSRALTFLGKAVDQGYRDARELATDADLKAVRGTTAFRDIEKAVQTLSK